MTLHTDSTKVNIFNLQEIFTFGYAIELLKQGKKVARQGWNGKGMYIYLQKGSVFPREDAKNEVLKSIDADTITLNSHIDMKISDGSICVGWLASQADMLAEDWVIVE